jgi:hypothetical protein
MQRVEYPNAIMSIADDRESGGSHDGTDAKMARRRCLAISLEDRESDLGREVARDFHTDANLSNYRSAPGHVPLPYDSIGQPRAPLGEDNTER